MRNQMKSSSSHHEGINGMPSSSQKEEKRESQPKHKENANPFDRVTDDVLLLILTALATTATCTSDLISATLVCKSFQRIGTRQRVLESASLAMLSIKADSWSKGADNFLRACAYAGNAEAAHILGMIYYYCLEKWQEGHALIHRAARQLNPSAVHSLAIMALNGSTNAFLRREKDVPAAIALCRLASHLGHIDATRELGHFYFSGYGMRKDDRVGRHLLHVASGRARAEFNFLCTNFSSQRESLQHLSFNSSAVRLYRQHIGCNQRQPRRRARARALPSPKLYPSNQFFLDWFQNRRLPRRLRRCSNEVCGLPETGRKEFARCSACNAVQYCSRACAGVDWYVRHKHDCPAPEWEGRPDQYHVEDPEDNENEENEGEEVDIRLVIPD